MTQDASNKQEMTTAEKLSLNVPGSEVMKKPGSNANYVTGFYVLDMMNRIFGHDGWSNETIKYELVHKELEDAKKRDGTTYKRWHVVFSAQTRVTLLDGTFHDGCACGSGQSTNLGEAMHNALGEAETDATKRACKSFGRVLGLALYDKRERYIGNKK